MNLQHRLAMWADRRLIPAVMVTLLITDVLVGLNWLLSPAVDLTSPAYDAAKQLWPMHVHGGVVLCAAALAACRLAHTYRSWLTGFLIGPVVGGIWLFWCVLFVLGPLGRPGASFLGAIVSGGLAVLHGLVGLGLASDPLADSLDGE